MTKEDAITIAAFILVDREEPQRAIDRAEELWQIACDGHKPMPEGIPEIIRAFEHRNAPIITICAAVMLRRYPEQALQQSVQQAHKLNQLVCERSDFALREKLKGATCKQS